MGDISNIGTEKLSITLFEKCASSNLEKFFLSKNLQLNRGQSVEDIDKNKTLIIVTRNEVDRWCAGVTQDIDQDGDIGDMTLNEFKELFMSSHNDSKLFVDLFMRGHSHLGGKLWFKDLFDLVNRGVGNTYFIDMDTLNQEKFWKWVCKKDSTWPNYKDWFSEWQEGYHKYPPEHIHKPITEWVRVILDNDERFWVIRDMLNANQRIIDSLFKSGFWLGDWIYDED